MAEAPGRLRLALAVDAEPIGSLKRFLHLVPGKSCRKKDLQDLRLLPEEVYKNLSESGHAGTKPGRGGRVLTRSRLRAVCVERCLAQSIQRANDLARYLPSKWLYHLASNRLQFDQAGRAESLAKRISARDSKLGLRLGRGGCGKRWSGGVMGARGVFRLSSLHVLKFSGCRAAGGLGVRSGRAPTDEGRGKAEGRRAGG